MKLIIKSLEFQFGNIVFGDFHIIFCDIISLEICHPYKWFFAINEVIYKYGKVDDEESIREGLKT